MKVLIWIFLFVLLIDGIKILVEAFSSYRKRKFDFDHAQVSVIIPLYNKEKEVGDVLKSTRRLFIEQNIFVVNDGSTDNSLKNAKQAAPNAQYISTTNQGKVRAIETALERITTPFVLILDADVVLPETFRCPTSLITGPITAVAFNVMPRLNFQKNLLLEFQSHEYAKSMQVGRKFQDKTCSVHCISGAIGLFKIDRLIELTKKHSKLWAGEDLERTLIELTNQGKVIFVDRVVRTETPRNLWQLIKQRITGWWPGLWRNIPLFLRAGVGKHTPWRLRWEAGYELFSLFTDPLKLVSLVVFAVSGQWELLFWFYLLYFGLEWIVYSQMRNGYTRRPIAVIGLYFFYNLFQVLLRLGGLMVFIWSWIKNRKWKKAFISLIVLGLIISPLSLNAEQKKQGIISIGYQKVIDSSGRRIDNCNLYLGYKGLFLSANTAKQAPRYLIVGKYLDFDGLVIVPEIRIKQHNKMMRLTINKPLFGSVVGRISGSYSFTETEAVADFPIVQLGADYYWGDYNYTSIDVIKEFGREHAITTILKNHLEFSNQLYLKTGIAVNNLGHKGLFVTLVFKQIYIGYSSFQNFDYCSFNRQYFTAGLKFKF